MSEQPQDNDLVPPVSAEQDVVVLIKKVQQRLVFLEKKIDILIGRSETRSVSEKRFSKPFRSFGSQHHRSDRWQGRPSGEKSSSPGRHSYSRRSEESRGSGYNKKAYDSSKESSPSQEGRFKNRYSGKKEGFDKKNKPFYYKQRDRG